MMKQRTGILLLMVVLFMACEPEIEDNSVNLNLYVKLSEPFGHKVTNAKVVLTHQTKNLSYTQHVQADGYANFNHIDPGFYTASTSYKLEASVAESVLNTSLSDSLSFNYSSGIDVLESKQDTIELYPAFSSALIIREFYYSGISNTETGKTYSADQYIEIYNNSDKAVKINGLLIAEHESYGNSYNPWSNIKDSVVIRWLWQIPADKERLLEPWHSVVIARDAIDHQTDSLGYAGSPVNLSKADYEFYMRDVNGQDIDTPAENMQEIVSVYRGNDITFHVKNGGGIMIARSDVSDLNSYILNNRLKKYNATGSSFKYVYKLPNNWILDAIDVLADENKAPFKRFPANIDAGFTYNKAKGSGKCITRKITTVVNGHPVYMDTNNSTVDFLIDQDPTPGLNE